MYKYLKKIFTSLLIIPMSLIFVSCNAHENSGIVVDGKENSDGVIDYIPESILFKRNARKTVSLLAKTVPSQSKGKIYCYLSENKVLTTDFVTYLKENNYSYSKTTINLSNNSLWSNFGELFGLGDNWEGIIEDFCFEHQNKTTIPKQYTPFATYGETIYFNGGSRALSVNLFYVNIWR